MFFFKQKTAYEMRISDWSSDVCSSDLLSASSPAGVRTLLNIARPAFSVPLKNAPPTAPTPAESAISETTSPRLVSPPRLARAIIFDGSSAAVRLALMAASRKAARAIVDASPAPTARSEEHTSELQSLMRISYAVFCLKKKK